MSAPRKRKASSASGAALPLRIRMYGVGFGDAFLLTIPGEPVRTVLVDAGFHAQGKGAFAGRELAQQVIADVIAATGKPRIDVVIATHRHQDHVFSFNASDWSAVEIGEVWLPWVEDPESPDARRLWKKQIALAAALAPRLAAEGTTAAQRRELEFLLWNAGVPSAQVLSPELASLYGAWSNAGALQTLRDGFARRDREKPRYLPATDASIETFETDVLPRVRVHVLAPARDPSLLKEIDPASDDETYRAFALATDAAAVGDTLPSPFGAPWHAKAAPSTWLDEDELARLDSLAASGDALRAARALDDMINATSLVLVLQIGRARLLFPGDAEWGTWKRILADERACKLLSGTTFIKVGHHGSHNATPVTLVEDVLPHGVCAMVSTQEGDGTFRNDIPLPQLLSALRDKKGIEPVRSDLHDADLPPGYSREESARWIDLELPW